MRSTLTYRTEAYGDHPDEQMDIFPAPRPSGAALIFLHGGAWQNFTKDEFSFVAKEFVTSGVTTVIVNFSKLPAVRLPNVVIQVRRAIKGCNLPRNRFWEGHGKTTAASALMVAQPWVSY